MDKISNINELRMRNRRNLLDHTLRIYGQDDIPADKKRLLLNYLMNGGSYVDLISKIKNNSIKTDILSRCGQISRIQLSSSSIDISAGLIKRLVVIIENRSNESFFTSEDRPIYICYHIYSEDDEVLIWDGMRTSIIEEIKPGERRELIMLIKSPELPGVYKVEPTLLIEGSRWFESKDLQTVKSDLNVVTSYLKVSYLSSAREGDETKKMSIEDIYKRIEVELLDLNN
jgi:hypothetical protein